VGCGNLSYSDFLRVPLTSVDQNSKMIGKMAATQALKMAESKTPVPRKSALVAPQLVVRASSLRAKRKPEFLTLRRNPYRRSPDPVPPVS